MLKIHRIKYEYEMQPAFTELEVDAIRRAAAGNFRDIAIVDFLLSTGCRLSELCDVNINDIDFENKRLQVIGKGNKKRVVYLTAVAVCSLKAYLCRRKDDRPALFVAARSPYNRLSHKGVQYILQKIGQNAHVKNVHPHRFRHTCCTRLLCRGMSIQDVARILGHANVNTTMVYNNTPDEFIGSKFRLYSY